MSTLPLLRLSVLPTTTNHHLKTPFTFSPPSFSLLKPSPSFTKTPFPFSPKPHLLKPLPPISSSFNSSTTTPATDRLLSSISYFLPFFNGLHYGRFMLSKFPLLALVFEPLLPFFSLYKSIPYASFVSFFGIYIGIVRNPKFSKYVRFNAMQALVLDVLLVLPLLLQRIFAPGNSGLGFKIMVMGHNFLFVFVCFCFVYGLVSSVLGKTPYLPLVADAAGRQL